MTSEPSNPEELLRQASCKASEVGCCAVRARCLGDRRAPLLHRCEHGGKRASIGGDGGQVVAERLPYARHRVHYLAASACEG